MNEFPVLIFVAFQSLFILLNILVYLARGQTTKEQFRPIFSS